MMQNWFYVMPLKARSSLHIGIVVCFSSWQSVLFFVGIVSVSKLFHKDVSNSCKHVVRGDSLNTLSQKQTSCVRHHACKYSPCGKKLVKWVYVLRLQFNYQLTEIHIK